MELERKAIYNLLRMNKHDAESCLPWQVENFKEKTIEALFKDLIPLGFHLDTRHFLAHAESFDTPEEFVDSIVPEELETKTADHIFLIIFELWRRLVPEKRSLSIICDEIDELICKYDNGSLACEEELQDLLLHLITLLEENVDAGLKPSELFDIVQANFANDLESFLFDYISEKIDQNHHLFATEILEDYYPFMTDKLWFDFLKARIMIVKDEKKANQIMTSLAHSTSLEKEFALELLQFLASNGDAKLFLHLAKRLLPSLESEDEFHELLMITGTYFCCLDQELLEKKVNEILLKRNKFDLSALIHKSDRDIKSLEEILHNYEIQISL